MTTSLQEGPVILIGYEYRLQLQAEADLFPDHEADPGDPEDVAPEPVFADVEEFVTLYFSQVINRQVSNSPGRGLSWDPRWWRHREGNGHCSGFGRSGQRSSIVS